MSSPSRKPENAASAAPVSTQGVAAGSPSASPVSAAAATGTATHSPSSDSLDLTGSSSISDHAWPSASVLPAVPAPVPAPPGSHVPSTSTPQSSLAVSHVDQNNKKSRPPATQRPNGPSLLTQALASARGILPSHVPVSHTDQRRPEQKPVPVPPNGTKRPSQPKNVYEPRTGHAVTGPQDAFHEHTEQGDLTPTGHSQFTEAARTISAPLLSSITYPGADAPTPLPVTMPATMSATTTLLEHRDFDLGARGRGRSLERTEKELRLRLTNLPIAHSDNVGDSSYSINATNADMAPSTDDKPELPSDARVQYRAWRVERPPLSMGPEKVWSIGTNDIVGHQDGQVEKSITEVLAGVEPTRSRKASHSLRFFKEGLPEETGRRRESKVKGLQLDLLRENQLDENAVFQTATPSPQPVEGEQPPSRLSSVQSFPWGTSDAESVPYEAVQRDYFGLQRPTKHTADPIKEPSPREQLVQAGVYSEPNGSAVVSDEDVTQVGRESSDVTEVGEPTEEGEESSEEKISSAVFLPHQGLEQSPENGCVITEEFKVSQSASRKSHGEDFHPWLVKADEPEAEVGARAEGPDSGNVDRKNDTAPYVEEFPRIDDECAVEDEVDFPQRPCDISSRSSRPVSQYYEDMVHEHQLGPKLPLEAIELIPYKHQVGGHTTIWRFSKRAVCKQLNNRENEFYEKIERYHRDLLPFLPRYIGVLNVTFQKQPRRKSTIKKDDTYASEKKGREQDGQLNGNNGASLGLPQGLDISDKDDQRHHRRIVSQSLQSSHTPIPTVTFVDNRHILPRSLLRPAVSVKGDNRPWSASAAVNPQFLRDNSTQTSNEDMMASDRPALPDRHANSWGATTVNKRLRNEVFNDAFLKQPIAVHKHRRPASQQRSIPRRSVQQPNRPTSSESALLDRKMVDDSERQAHESNFLQAPPRILQSHSDLSADSSCLRLEGLDHVKDVTGTSAPEPETLSEKYPHQRRRRRNSGSKLRRRPQDVTESRGNLKYFEDPDEVEYSRDDDPHPGLHTLVHVENGYKQDAEAVENGFVDNSVPQSYFSSAVPSELPSPTTEFKKIPRPVNPKEAQTQHDSRVEYFLLLEDLTAGMKRPCIMDLKMGTRQYGVEASPKKRESQQRKCAATTSREHGVRLCGLQSWDAKSQTYVFKDKYYGRNLKAGSEFQDALTMFLYDGVDYSSVLRHIPTILQKLNQLEMTIRRLRGYRFYAASLLMFYDADDSDEGYDTAADDSTTDFATDAEDAWEARRRRKNKKEIDFKMADFANSVTAGDLAEDKPCPPKCPNEPDRGFLRGLATLRKYFLKIQKDVRNELGLIAPRRQEDDGSEVEKDDDGSCSVSD